MKQQQYRLGNVQDMLRALGKGNENGHEHFYSELGREGHYKLVELLTGTGLIPSEKSAKIVSLPPAEQIRSLLAETTFGEEFATNQPFYQAGKGAWAVWIVWVLVASPPADLPEMTAEESMNTGLFKHKYPTKESSHSFEA